MVLNSPFTKTLCIDFPPLPLWSSLSELSETLPPRLQSSVQFNSVAQLCPTICNPMNLSTPGLPVHHQILEFTQTHVHQVSDGIQPSHPLSSPSPPAPSPSQHQSQLFAGGGQSTGVSALASVLPGLISFRMDWLDLLAVQRTLKSLLQHHSSKASIL